MEKRGGMGRVLGRGQKEEVWARAMGEQPLSF
jgi:hypothetical protein